MKVTAYFLLLVGMLCTTAIAHAEGGCPSGMIPYSGTNINSCGPIPSGYYQGGQKQQSPAVEWASKWGAIATDSRVGAFGASTHMPNRAEAETAAIKQCQDQGGKNCEIETWYANGCSATVMGKNTHSTNNADALNEAVEIGMKKCSTGDSECHVFYSDCSLPERIQ